MSTNSAQRAITDRIGEAGTTIDGVEYKNCNIVQFDGHSYIFSHRAILTVVVLSKCNAACHFCSNEITFTPAGRTLEWNSAVKRARDFALTAGVRKVAYTGGEPTLHPQRLYELISKLNPGFAKSRLHTNGFGLFRDVTNSDGAKVPLLDALIGAGLTGVSVSVAHHEAARNRQIMKLPRAWSGMDEASLSAVADLRSSSFTPRLSCVITREGVADVDDIFAYLEWGRALGFQRFIFRTCSDIPDEFKKPTSFSAFNDDNRMSLEPLSAAIEARAGVRRVFRQRKSDSKVDVFEWGGITFDVDESGEEVDGDRKIRRLNLMPNGLTYTSWIDPLAVLFEDEMAAARESMAREFTPLAIAEVRR
ncbi:radical SAM protein [Nocardia nova]